MIRGKHALSYTHLTTMNMGSIVPIGCVEALPGDTIQHLTSSLIRTSPLTAPVMHPVDVSIAHWFCPTRLLWDDWEDFITGGPDGANASLVPTISMPAVGGAAVGSLADHLGVPTGVNSLPVMALPFRAYAMIFNEWYRDQDLVNKLVVSTASGPDTTTSTALMQGAWQKDYFTTARPTPQKGPAVTIPIGSTAPVKGIGVFGTGNAVASGSASFGTDAGGDMPTGTPGINPGAQTIIRTQATGAVSASNRPRIYADLTGVAGVTISQLREALALQRYMEARSMYGSRYTEYLAYLGVKSSDARLQRPEYLGGGHQNISFSEVLQTAEGDGSVDDTVGSLKGHGISALRSNRYRRFIEEHGYVISCMIVRPKAMYIQGLDRMWNRRDKEDWWQRELEHIGQQEVLNKEVYAAGPQPDGVFGYGNRYDEYRGNWSKITGQFRTIYNNWHFGRAFSSAPALNADFINCIPSEEPFADNADDVLWVMNRHSMQARRLVSNSYTPYIY